MFRRLLASPCIVTVLAVSLSGGSARAADLDPPLDAATACPDWRWVGVLPGESQVCPPAGGQWSQGSLFASPDASPIPPGLVPYCVYEWGGPPPAQVGRIQNLVESRRLVRADPDCMAVAPASANGDPGTLGDQVWPALATHFLEQAGQADLPPSLGADPTRLAIVDTGPTNELAPEADPGNSPHGYTLANMAGDLLCPPGGCLAEVTARLALPYLTFARGNRAATVRDDVNGGFIGTIGELAQVVRSEVYEWQSDAGDPTPERRLVLNLSLAWSPRFGGSQPLVPDMPAPVQAVYRAAEDAACRGALVVAAAGNRSAGPAPSSGSLLPAGWERRFAPSFASCQLALEAPPDPDDFPPIAPPVYRPLIVAAGALQSMGQPLITARAMGEPRIAAFGDHGVVESHLTGEPTATLSGASVGTQIVSAAAAAVWTYRPDLRADEVISIVHAAGEDLGRRADFCLGGAGGVSCPQGIGSLARVRRASVCAAAVEACAAGGEKCPDPGEFPVCPAWPADPPTLPEIELPGAMVVAFADLDSIAPTDPDCGPETLRHEAGYSPSDPCPHRQYFDGGLESWIDPQPGSDPCPNCLGRGPATGPAGSEVDLFVEIDPAWAGDLTDATLKVGNFTFNLSVPALAAGEQVLVTDAPLGGRTAALLTFTRALPGGGRQSALAPVVLVP